MLPVGLAAAPDELAFALHFVQRLEPAGVGAREHEAK
jgi:DNA-directed RNA polymerase specialized sigma54-like protein